MGTGINGCKWTTDLKRGGASVWNWVGDYSWVNNANKFEFKTMDKVVQSQMSPFYGWDHFYVGKYYNNGERTRTVTYEKKNRNFLLGKVLVEDKLVLDGERFGHFKLDTRDTPYTMVWFSKPVRRLVPITRDFFGQDELTVSAWHTPGKELKFETNHPEFRTMKITSAGPTKTFWFNGEEKATVDFNTASKKASHTMHLPNGKDLTRNLKVDAIVWKSFAGQKYGFTLNNDKFTLLAGK